MGVDYVGQAHEVFEDSRGLSDETILDMYAKPAIAQLEAERDELETMLKRKHVRWNLLMAERTIAEMSGGRDDD